MRRSAVISHPTYDSLCFSSRFVTFRKYTAEESAVHRPKIWILRCVNEFKACLTVLVSSLTLPFGVTPPLPPILAPASPVPSQGIPTMLHPPNHCIPLLDILLIGHRVRTMVHSWWYLILQNSNSEAVCSGLWKGTTTRGS